MTLQFFCIIRVMLTMRICVYMSYGNDNDTQRSPSNNCQWPGLAGISVGVMTHAKKNLLKLMGLALLARYALAHCSRQCVGTSNIKHEGMSQNTGCCWNKFSEFENRLNPQILCNKTKGARGTRKTAGGKVWQAPELISPT